MTSDATTAAKPESARTDTRLRFELPPQNCFACGSLNRSGLRLDIHVERERAWCDLALGRRFEGWDGIADGGILATVLDEVMAWSLVGQDEWGVTAKLAVDFKRPAPVELPLHAEGRVVRARRRLIETTARIVDAPSGDELATAHGVYVAADRARKRELQERYRFRLLDRPDGPDTVDPA